MKWDIFNGKIKKEYYGYMMFTFIFTSLLSLALSGVGVVFTLAAIMGKITPPSLITTIIVFLLGVIFIIQSPIFIFLQLLVIRNYPKYEKIRKRMYNSDCYFVGCDSFEYNGKPRGRWGRRNKAAFDLITTTTELEKGVKGTKLYPKYRMYSLLSCTSSLIGLVSMFSMFALLGDNKTILPKVLQNDNLIIFMTIVISIAFLGLAISFYIRAMNVAIYAPLIEFESRFAWYDSLTEIAVRKSKGKHKFGYRVDQIKEIEAIVNNSGESLELKIEENNGRLACFKVIDTTKNYTVFSGYFIQKR